MSVQDNLVIGGAVAAAVLGLSNTSSQGEGVTFQTLLAFMFIVLGILLLFYWLKARKK